MRGYRNYKIIKYYYFDRELSSIVLQGEKGECKIYAMKATSRCTYFHSYPITANTIIARLLNYETAMAAVEEMGARIDGSYVEPAEEPTSPWVVIGAIGGGVVAVALVATASSLVTVKVMRKKAKRKEEDVAGGEDGNGGNGGAPRKRVLFRFLHLWL